MKLKQLLKVSLLISFLLSPYLAQQACAIQTAGDILSLGDSLLSTNTDSASQEKAKKDTVVQERSINNIIYALQDYIITTNHINKVLERNIDTLELSINLPTTERRLDLVRSRLEERDNDINLRYLSALKNFTNYQTRQLAQWKENIDAKDYEISAAKDSLRKIKNDEILNLSIKDPETLPTFQNLLSELNTRIKTADSLYLNQQLILAGYQSRLSRAIIEINDFKEEIEERESILERALFNKEVNYIWEPKSDERKKKIWDVISHSYLINRVILNGYGEVNKPTHILVFSLVVLAFLWIRYLLRHIKSEKEFSEIILQRTRFIPKHPFASAMIIILPITPFFYRSPPVILTVAVLAMMMVITSLLIRAIVSKKVFIFWLIFLTIFIIYSLSNLYIETAFEERWTLLILSILSITLGYHIISSIRNSTLTHPKYIIFLIQLFLIIQGLSAFANILGRYSLSKILGIAATTSLMQAIGLYVFVLVIMEAIYLQIEMSKKSSKDYTAYFDFQDIQEKVQKIFVFIASAIWFYYLAVNLTVYDYIYANISLFLSE
ncbi:hypothetical protein [Echinicola sp. 20G]|uniref:hypothetical protein n=1 Tax=Echinicola sp. 20G TaxID=2781961 RepID=UPI001F2D6436|nr:hypothetical protein [Echinicola sp. 20G]